MSDAFKGPVSSGASAALMQVKMLAGLACHDRLEEPMNRVTLAFQRPVQFVEHHVGQYGRQGAALRHPFCGRLLLTIDLHPAFEKAVDEFEHIGCIHVLAQRTMSRSWLTRSKNASKSMSTTQPYPCRIVAWA